MVKNKKTDKKTDKKTETDTSTDTTDTTDTSTDTSTDTCTGNNKKSSSIIGKFNNLSKKTKLYIGIIMLLFIIAGYMWYKNKDRTEIKQIQNENIGQIKHLSPSPVQEVAKL